MGMVGSMVKMGIAKKVFDEARKPKNQAKLKSMFAQVTGKDSKSSGSGSSAPMSRRSR